MHIEPRLLAFTRGIRTRIAGAVALGLFSVSMGVARLGLLGWLIGQVFAGRTLAERGAEILGRLEAAETELSAHVGLSQGSVRLAAFPSALGTFVPRAAALLATRHPGLRVILTEAEPPEAVRMLRAGYVDVGVIFRYDRESEDDGVGTRRLLDEPS